MENLQKGATAYFQFRYGASLRTARSNFDATDSHKPVKLSSKRWSNRTSARSGRFRDTTFTTGSVTADTSRLRPGGQSGRRSARRVSGFTKQGTGPASGHLSFWKSLYEDSDSPRPSEAPTFRSHIR